MMILIITYLNYYYNNNLKKSNDNYIIYFFKRLFLLYLLYINTFYELTYNNYAQILNNYENEEISNEEISNEEISNEESSNEESSNEESSNEESSNEESSNEEIIKDNKNNFTDIFEISTIQKMDEEEPNNCLDDFLVSEPIIENMSETEELKNFINDKEEIVDIIQPELLEEEISLDNIHFGSFIDSLDEIENEKKPVVKEVKKIKVGKNKKITTEMIMN